VLEQLVLLDVFALVMVLQGLVMPIFPAFFVPCLRQFAYRLFGDLVFVTLVCLRGIGCES